MSNRKSITFDVFKEYTERKEVYLVPCTKDGSLPLIQTTEEGENTVKGINFASGEAVDWELTKKEDGSFQLQQTK